MAREAATTKIIHSVEAAGGLSRHEKTLRKRIEESILQSAANDDREIDEAELKRLVFLEESSKKARTHPTDLLVLTYAVSKSEVDLVTKFVWDRGLRGSKNKRLIEELYKACELPTTAIARRDKIDTKVHNVYRTYRETNEMFSDDEQPVEDLAARLFDLLNRFQEREGAVEALAIYGISVGGEEEE